MAALSGHLGPSIAYGRNGWRAFIRLFRKARCKRRLDRARYFTIIDGFQIDARQEEVEQRLDLRRP